MFYDGFSNLDCIKGLSGYCGMKKPGPIDRGPEEEIEDPAGEERQNMNGLNANVSPDETAVFPLPLARVGDRVRIVSLNGGRGFHDRLAGVGLGVGVVVEIMHNAMDGKLLLGNSNVRLFLGGGMAHKIKVAIIEGGKNEINVKRYGGR